MIISLTTNPTDSTHIQVIFSRNSEACASEFLYNSTLLVSLQLQPHCFFIAVAVEWKDAYQIQNAVYLYTQRSCL